jgi:geranylgeranyl diphosphate synthase, type II
MKTLSEPAAAEQAPDVREFLASCRASVDTELDRLIPSETAEPVTVHRAIRWSLLAGGKRFRPALVFASGQAFGAPTESLLATACAFEMIHTYSLIHDDLPSMDNDDLRRGRATCHVKFGEATAILAGDALQTLAFQTIADDERLAAETRVRVIQELARGAGTPLGMVAGQAHDLEGERSEVNDAQLEVIHRSKTGALITAAARCGAIIGDALEDEIEAVGEYAAQLGLLFQITDDLLDVTATSDALGKTPGKDERSSKATYPALYGVESTRERAAAMHRAAIKSLDRIDRSLQSVALLREIADFILRRDA